MRFAGRSISEGIKLNCIGIQRLLFLNKMATGRSTQQNFRKALGAVKDSTTVGLAKVNSYYKDLDIAIVKATNHAEVLPKEKHIQTILIAVSAPRPQVGVVYYCIHALGRRLAKTHNWVVALKALIVVHRVLRELDPTFCVELINHSQRRILNLSFLRDDSSQNAWEYSAWVRSYAQYLEERLECFQTLKYDVLTDCPRTKDLGTSGLLEQLPALQQLLFRNLACQPVGAARYNFLIQHALATVAAETVKLYVAITDGALNFVDKFFEMQRQDAVRALEIYRKAGDQAKRLSEFFEVCRGLDFGRGQKYIRIEQLPASFMEAMEDYVKDAPETLTLTWKEIGDKRVETPKVIAAPKPDLETDHNRDGEVEEKSNSSAASSEMKSNQNEAVAASPFIDLLSFDEPVQQASELEDKNPLALAIFTPEDPSNLTNNSMPENQSTSWELALVTAPSSNGATVVENKLAGGLDKQTLDCLCNDALAWTNQSGNYQTEQAASPVKVVPCNQDAFYASNNLVPPTNAQMAAVAQQREALIMHQPPVGHLQPNSFGNPFVDQMDDSRNYQTEPMASPSKVVPYDQDIFYGFNDIAAVPQTDVQMASEVVAYNQDHFYALNDKAAAQTDVQNLQMEATAQQEQAWMIMQPQQQQPPVTGLGPTNPSGNPFFEQNTWSYPTPSPHVGLI